MPYGKAQRYDVDSYSPLMRLNLLLYSLEYSTGLLGLGILRWDRGQKCIETFFPYYYTTHITWYIFFCVFVHHINIHLSYLYYGGDETRFLIQFCFDMGRHKNLCSGHGWRKQPIAYCFSSLQNKCTIRIDLLSLCKNTCCLQQHLTTLAVSSGRLDREEHSLFFCIGGLIPGGCQGSRPPHS